jgi:hypothetical protein
VSYFVKVFSRSFQNVRSHTLKMRFYKRGIYETHVDWIAAFVVWSCALSFWL